MPPTPRTSIRRHAQLRLSLIALAALLLTSGCAYFNTFYHAKKFYGEAEKTQKTEQRQNAQAGAGASSGLYKKAIEKCEKVIQDYPGSKWQDDAYLLLAKSHYGRGDYLAAQQAVSTLLASFPESELRTEGIHWQGRIQFANEDYAEAQVTWAGLLEEFPKFDHREEVEYFLAQATWLGGDKEGAIAGYGAFLKRYPKGDYSAGARLDMGDLLVQEERYPEAEKVFTEVSNDGKSESDRIEGKIRLGEVLELENRIEDARELYARLEVELDPEILKGRMTVEERRDFEAAARQAALEAARVDSLRRIELQNSQDPAAVLDGEALASQTNQAAAGLGSQPMGAAGMLNRRDINDPRQKQLARVMLREGAVLAKLDRAEDAILVYEQVVSEFPQTPFAAEGQYRLGYTYEVNLEEFERAQSAYDAVARQGNSSFREDAQRRSKNLITLRGLMNTAAKDSLSQAEAAVAEAKFMRAELYLFQQENVEKAVEEYRSIETEFPGSEHAAKAGLALAWITQHSLGDSAGAMTKYAEVARTYPDTEYGRRASLVAFGPEPEPEPIDFAGPSVEELTSPENLALAQAKLLAEEASDSTRQSGPAPTDLASGPPAGPGVAAAGTQLVETTPGPPSPVSPSGSQGATPAELGVAGAAGAAAASLGEMVEASRRQAEAVAAGAGPDVAAASSGAEPEVATAPDEAGADNATASSSADASPTPSATDASIPVAGAVVGAAAVSIGTGASTPSVGEPSIQAVGEPPTQPVAEPSAQAVGEPSTQAVGEPSTQAAGEPFVPPGDPPGPPVEAGQAGVAVSPPARPDSSARAVALPEDLYLNPMAVPADGPTPVATPPAPETKSGNARKSARDSKSSSEKPPPDEEKPSKSKDDSGKNDSGKSDSKPKEEPAKKDGDSSKAAAPDSTSGKGSS